MVLYTAMTMAFITGANAGTIDINNENLSVPAGGIPATVYLDSPMGPISFILPQEGASQSRTNIADSHYSSISVGPPFRYNRKESTSCHNLDIKVTKDSHHIITLRKGEDRKSVV